MERVHGICRSCAAMCPLVIDKEGDRIVSILGDRENSVYHGYSCIKGRELTHSIAAPERLMRSMKRRPDGSFDEIDSETALDEIAAQLRAIIDRYGPRAVATYAGTFIFTYPATQPLATAWMKAIGSPMKFTAATIDQPGKAIAAALHGGWQAGPQVFDDSDTWLLVGVNPIVAKSGGVPNQNPAKRLKDAVEQRGMQLVVIDPRRTEPARWAAVHLQPYPGEDPAVLAGMVRVVIEEQRYDRAFVGDFARGLEVLRAAVEPFTPQYVEQRAGVPTGELVKAARIFADARRGGGTVGTGPNMAPRGNLTEYLVLCLMTLCGRWLAAGERVPNPGVLGPRFEPRAQPNPPVPAWGYGEKLRIRGFTDTVIGLPTAALADEILLEGDGQVKALICIGGNPLMAWPDQRKTLKALKQLELFVCLDVQMQDNSCHLADYVLACKHQLESPAMTLPNEMLSFFAPGFGYSMPYAQYAGAVVEPPAGSDLIEEWEFFHGLARRMGLDLDIEVAYSWADTGHAPPRIRLDPDSKPSTEDLYRLLTEQSRVPLDTVAGYPGGHVFDDLAIDVADQEQDCNARLELGDATMMAELREVATQQADRERYPDYPFRLISRRLPNVFNSTGRSNPRQLRKYKYNPAFMHPEDVRELGVSPGDIIDIRSDHDVIQGVVEVEPELRRGVISMSHCFGSDPDNEQPVREKGSSVGRLTSVETEYDPYTGIPRMSAIPVRVSPRLS